MGTENRAYAHGRTDLDGEPLAFELGVPAPEKPQALRLQVKVLRPDGTVAMERTLAAP